MGTGLGNFEGLLMFEQWGYSKQDLGTNHFIGGMTNLFIVIPIVGLLADKMDRLTMFTIGTVGSMAVRVAYYVYVQFILPEHRPSIGDMVMFGQFQSIVGQFGAISFLPLLYDYVPRDKMGTAQAGFNFVRSITRMVMLNGLGLWVTYYSKWFMPPGQYDYFSGYLFMLILDCIGLAILTYFGLQVRRGKIKPLGRTEFRPLEDVDPTDTPNAEPAR
jgi:hypothetical protein